MEEADCSVRAESSNSAVLGALHEFYSCSAGWVGLQLAV